MSILSGLRGYYRTAGIRGVLAISGYRLLRRPKEIIVKPEWIRKPIHLRVRTTDLSTYNDILLNREYAFAVPATPRTIVDGGANIGMASIFYTHTYPQARIIAIEPEASNFAMLVKNVREYPNIVPIHAALWNRDGVISVSLPASRPGAFAKWGFVTHEGQGSPVRAITVKTLMAEMGMPSIDLLKVDIEGAEREVFEACDWMDKVECLVIELHDRFKPGCRAAVEAATRGLSTVERGETTWYFRESAAPNCA